MDEGSEKILPPIRVEQQGNSSWLVDRERQDRFDRERTEFVGQARPARLPSLQPDRHDAHSTRRTFLKLAVGGVAAAVLAKLGLGPGQEILDPRTQDQIKAEAMFSDPQSKDKIKTYKVVDEKDVIENGGLNYRTSPEIPLQSIAGNSPDKLPPGSEIIGIEYEGKEIQPGSTIKGQEKWVAFKGSKGQMYFANGQYLKEVPAPPQEVSLP